ncbi:hypothetical protein J4E83_003652 [Alternaria metachromatica]|uniref:uncharacterized protein n=1 Tax=Alternaria metachromatica TaxID=283354 RepID=UPI0020C40D9C|nr:uncharacterized protein J4E83_003652 [Alternaria metachromatica]KAI4626501.1 hypothetical protein J4E83_003652 [Alternaria metachromatica]
MDDTGSQPPPVPEMTPSNARTIAKDLPVNLTSLDQALRPFRHSYTHTNLILALFHAVLQGVYDCHKKYPDGLPPTAHQEHIHDLWHRASRAFRDPHSSWYDDPESLQVAQMMAKQDPVHIWFDVDSHVRQDIFGGNPSDIAIDLGRGYTKIKRGVKWLVDCATLSLSEEPLWSKEKDTATANLAAVATCAPVYGLAESSSDLAHSHELFGPGGVLWSVMEVFTREPDHSSGIVGILDMVIQQTLNVALLFRYSLQHDDRLSHQQPAYKWYARGLEEARTKYIYSVECQDPQALMPYHVRNGLKNIHFIELWDAIWEKAYDLSRTFTSDPLVLEIYMFLWTVQQMRLPYSDPRPWIPGANVALIVEKRCKEYEINIDGVLNIAPDDIYNFDTPPNDFHISKFSNQIDVEAILRSRGPRFSSTARGHRFYEGYDDSDVADTDDDEDENLDLAFDDTADVEPYGPPLDLIDLAATITTVPEDQYCTVCMENHSHSTSDGGTMKLNSCGHLFHYKCMYEWLNGTSSNSNLCPECRVQFSEQRRPVRPVQPASVSSSESGSTWLVSTSDDFEAEEERSLEPISQQNRADGDALNGMEETSAHRDTAAQSATSEGPSLEHMTLPQRFIVYEGDANLGDNDEEEDNDHEDLNDSHDTSSSSTSSPDAGLGDPQENVSVPANTRRQNRILSIDYSATWDGRAFSDEPDDENEEGLGEIIHDYDYDRLI